MYIDIRKYSIALLKTMDSSQWTYIPSFENLEKTSILTRDDLRKINQVKGVFEAKTSGSTGEQVTVQKTIDDAIWSDACNMRYFLWKKWDTSKSYALIKPIADEAEYDSWNLPNEIFKNQGKFFINGMKPLPEIQKWLEEKNPHYIFTKPSLLKELDLSKITNLIDTGSTGENGGDMYSSEDCGVIAIQCPDNKDYFHVMENIIVETGKDGEAIITSMTNPYIKRYLIGDHLELGQCTCGRSLQSIKKILGRTRNMFVLPNGDKKWVILGSQSMYDKFGIKRYQAVQTDIENLDMYIISDHLGELKEQELKAHMLKHIKSTINIHIKYTDSFPDGKFEEFKSLIS